MLSRVQIRLKKVIGNVGESPKRGVGGKWRPVGRVLRSEWEMREQDNNRQLSP